MMEPIEQGFMVFLAEGQEGIGAVRHLKDGAIVVYVENGGEFTVPLTSVRRVHDKKVVLDPQHVDTALLNAVRHAHDKEDPKLAG
jgi:hypothetical protein